MALITPSIIQTELIECIRRYVSGYEDGSSLIAGHCALIDPRITAEFGEAN